MCDEAISSAEAFTLDVIPANAGISIRTRRLPREEIPAFAGMTRPRSRASAALPQKYTDLLHSDPLMSGFAACESRLIRMTD